MAKKNKKELANPENVPQSQINETVNGDVQGLQEMNQINPMIIPDFFNNIRNNYYVGNKIIWLSDYIEWSNITEIIKKLSFYDDGTKDPIYIYISSPGGLCDAGWALIDVIEKLKKKHIEVNTICVGSCSSMASIILAAGSKGHRYAFPSSRIMIHQAGVDLTGGKLDEIKNTAQELEYWTGLIEDYLLKNGNFKNREDVVKALSYDNFMDVKKAKKLGIIDKIDVVMA